MVAPRIHYLPRATGSKAQDVFEMAELVGFSLDPWQRLVVEGVTLTRGDGKWAAFEAGMCVPRQNGKDGILEMIELTAVFTWKEKLVIHSAHEFITSQKHFDRIWSLVENTPKLLNRVQKQKPLRSHGHEGFRTVDGCQIEFRTRTKGGGRGFSCDRLLLNEAMILPEASMGALFPTLRARPNPQVIYAGSAVDQEVHNEGVVFTRVRNRALEGQDPALAYFEWSLAYEHPDDVPDEELLSEAAMRTSNPAYDIRIFREHFEKEVRTLSKRTACVELYGVGDWPDPSASDEYKISPEQWAECQDATSELVGTPCFAFDTSPERRTCIAAAGHNQNGDWHVEVIEKLPGTGWLPSKLYDLEQEHQPGVIAYDKIGPSSSLLNQIDDLGISVEPLDTQDIARACGRLVDAVQEGTLRHLGSHDLWNAIQGAKSRPLGDAWAWSRKASKVDISPLVAATLALYAAQNQPEGGELVIY